MITDTQLQQVKSLLSGGEEGLATALGELIKKFELDRLGHKLKGKDKIKLELVRQHDGKKVTVIATKINSMFAYHDSVTGKKMKTLTHLPSGLSLISGVRKVVLYAVSEVRKLSEDTLTKLDHADSARIDPIERDLMRKILKDAKTFT